VDAYLGVVAVFLVFAEPVVNAIVEEHAAAVGVDVRAVVVGPGLTGVKIRPGCCVGHDA
jgi:hypothetical protein